jgi:hypothetical protein
VCNRERTGRADMENVFAVGHADRYGSAMSESGLGRDLDEAEGGKSSGAGFPGRGPAGFGAVL